jgi:hypothetical protein
LTDNHGIRTIIVETASRFARDLMVQEVGYERLRNRAVGKGKDAKPDPIHLIAADSPSAFLDDGPTSKLIRQVLGAVAEFDKAMTVAKLRGARERRRREKGKCEGRKSHAEKRRRGTAAQFNRLLALRAASFMSPAAWCAEPLALSTLPSACRFLSPVILPIVSFTAPLVFS